MGLRGVGLLVGLLVGLSVPATLAHAGGPAGTTGRTALVAGARDGTNTSINWSGYAVHRRRVRFRRVSGEWRVPNGSCAAGSAGYSAFWVGLGGYRLNSRALEQVGTELDCTPTGRTVLSAWYELVPAPVHRIRIRLRAGDLVKARVKVRRDEVTVWLFDLTRHRSFRKTVNDRHTDTTSAEWIAEAPSECLGAVVCQVLPLADFGKVSFMHATVESRRYRWGGIASRRWNWSQIFLANTNGRRYVAGSSASARATPSTLAPDGRSFTVTYAGTPSPVTTGPTVASTWVAPRTRPLARLGR